MPQELDDWHAVRVLRDLPDYDDGRIDELSLGGAFGQSIPRVTS
jgi:hypothetical protein